MLMRQITQSLQTSSISLRMQAKHTFSYYGKSGNGNSSDLSNTRDCSGPWRPQRKALHRYTPGMAICCRSQTGKALLHSENDMQERRMRALGVELGTCFCGRGGETSLGMDVPVNRSPTPHPQAEPRASSPAPCRAGNALPARHFVRAPSQHTAATLALSPPSGCSHSLPSLPFLVAHITLLLQKQMGLWRPPASAPSLLSPVLGLLEQAHRAPLGFCLPHRRDSWDRDCSPRNQLLQGAQQIETKVGF